MRRFTICVLTFIASIPTAHAASFDCAKASHPLEHMICDNTSLSQLDEEMAALYKEKLEIILDKASLKGQQADWQKILRQRCQETCLLQEVESDYVAQISTLKAIAEETYSANYKISDEALLTISNHSKEGFEFHIDRMNIDTSEDVYCDFPARTSAGETGTARFADPNQAVWEGGNNCQVTFDLERDGKGSVVLLKVSTQNCDHVCNNNYHLDDNYIPSNNWVAGNQ